MKREDVERLVSEERLGWLEKVLEKLSRNRGGITLAEIAEFKSAIRELRILRAAKRRGAK